VQAAAGRDACLAPVLSIDEAPGHGQLRARDTYADFDGVRHPSPAPRLSRTPASLRHPAPAAGQHSREVLADWGLGADAVAALVDGGVVADAA
jgi:alpha-methylacyl-CoA racemase